MWSTTFPFNPSFCMFFSALPAISAARRFIHSTGKKVPATIYTVYHWYFWAGYRYPHGTGIPVWTPSYSLVQCLSQDLETVCLKLAILGRPNFSGGSQYTHVSTFNMYKFIKIRHDIIKQCHGYYKRMKKFN